jgi:hypothetical protein
MANLSLRKAALLCLATWLGIWVVFMLMRFSPLDIRIIPGIGPLLLVALVVALLAPIVAAILAGAALLRQPRDLQNLLTLGCALAALVGQMFIFTLSQWM